MAFNDLLQQLGGIGRFQQIQVTLLLLPMLLMASHNTLQNFTAAIPTHHCRPPAEANLSKEGEAWLPRDRQGQPESCLQFTSPQQGPPFPNGTETDGVGATEPCTNGWIYDNSTFPSTIVTEGLTPTGSVLVYGWGASRSHSVRAPGRQAGPQEGADLELPADSCDGDLCGLRSQLSHLLCLPSPLGHVDSWHHPQQHDPECGVDAHSHAGPCRHPDWLCLQSGPVPAGWRGLCCAPLAPTAVGGLCAVFRRLHLLLVLRASLQKELTMGKVQASAMELLRCPTLRRLFLCLSMLWFATSFAYYGLVMDLQGFGVSIYLIQVIFGAVDLPAKLVSFLVINSLGRRPAQMASLLLAGICILVNGMMPRDQSIVRTSLAVLGKGCLASSFNCIFLYTGEVYPTMIRQTGLGMGSMTARLGSIVSPLVSMTSELYPTLPLFIYGTIPVAASAVVVLLPETMGQPLPDTVQDIKNRRRGKPKRQQQEQQKQMIPLQASAQEKNGP
ncbi:solute carrier family 22 member 6 isoform X3 [Rhinolophus ferrumequinum]|uniref:solute carrier family 22 member 6 isoform X3 n=1 Tax=Rhinolophus ferrumequinum TaxID=59479 RepID=UPI00140FE1CF|nr:solute carrier family 22 member 6 isoform X3 [Rhinolophus ferrumequinum]